MNRKTAIILLSMAFITACTPCEPNTDDFLLPDGYKTLPEKMIATDEQTGMKALYVVPTSVYNHGILGDTIESGGLLVSLNKVNYVYLLDSTMVFEDLQPRLKDLNGDGIPEIITILTSISQGASVALFKIGTNKLILLAKTDYIGTTRRWLNIAAIDDLDKNGTIEIAYVATPHIGGVLTIAEIENDNLKIFTQQPGVSNHRKGSRNLCLSAVTVTNGVKTLYLPNNEFSSILGFQWQNYKLIATDTIAFNVDPLIPLSTQYNFTGLQTDNNCISYK